MSTTDATCILKETINSNLGHKCCIYAKFINLSKAFNLVNHYILAEKLLDSDVLADLVALLCSYLRNQTAWVTCFGNEGPYICINKGVRQGGI